MKRQHEGNEKSDFRDFEVVCCTNLETLTIILWWCEIASGGFGAAAGCRHPC